MTNGESSRLKGCVALAVLALAGFAAAFPEIPKASAKALRVTRGKPISDGLVFIDGKYIAPPYVVERWGTGIRINSKPVTGQVIDWNEFVKTQSGAKVSKTEVLPSSPTPVVISKPADIDYSSALDDLFEDDPKPKKPVRKSVVPAAPAVAKPKVVVNYELDGDFVANDASKALVARINASRTEIDRLLRTGGFAFFGSSYPRVTGDSRSAIEMVEKLVALQRSSENVASFKSGVHNANLIYFNDALCEDLFKNRIDYRRLQERLAKIKEEAQLQKVLQGGR